MNKRERAILQELANALQAANLRAGRLRHTLGDSVEDAVAVEAATRRAVSLLKGLQLKDTKRGKSRR